MMIRRRGRRSSLAILAASVVLAMAWAPEASPVQAAFPGSNGRIAFVRANLDDGSCPFSEIWTIKGDGKGLRKLDRPYEGVIGGVSWSPDGKRLAFTVQTESHEPEGVNGVHVINADGTGETGLRNVPVPPSWKCDPQGPTWSPDGTKLAVGGDGGIWTIDLANGNEMSLITANAPDFYDQPAWSPDGELIAVRVPARGAIGVIPAGGGTATLLTDAMAASRPNWSPDGKLIAFEIDVGGEIGILDRCNGSVRTIPRLVGEHHPAWSPDGSRMAFWSDVGAGSGVGFDVLTMSPDGADVVNLTKTDHPIREAMPDWQPTGPPPKFPGCPIAFDYSVPDRFGLDQSGDGLIDYATSPEEVQHDRYPVKLTVSAGDRRCDPRKRYAWSADGRPLEAVQRAGDKCVFDFDFPAEGIYDVLLKVDGQNASHREVMVQDWLIVSLGDSVASGEGNPDVPGGQYASWQDYRCDRSAFARGAQAAERLEKKDPKTSVTFVHLACSGATVHKGVLGPYDGINPGGHVSPIPPQIDQLEELVGDREIDAVDLSIGANDVGFGPIMMFCAVYEECLDRPFDDLNPILGVPQSPLGADFVPSVVSSRIEALPDSYDALASRLERLVPRDRVYVTEYPDLTKDEAGEYCDEILWLYSELDTAEAQSLGIFTGSLARVTSAEAEGLYLFLLGPLNTAVVDAAAAEDWNLVSGAEGGFRTHGYCATVRWVRQLAESRELQGNNYAALHPNVNGHHFTSELVLTKMLEDLYEADGSPRAPETGRP